MFALIFALELVKSFDWAYAVRALNFPTQMGVPFHYGCINSTVENVRNDAIISGAYKAENILFIICNV